LIAYIFSQRGFQVALTKQTRDGGRDIIAIRSDFEIRSKYIIECKRYAAHKRVGVGLVTALYGVQTREGANKSVLVTTSQFTAPALKFANGVNTTKWAMDLKDYDDVCQWITSAATKKQFFK
jgi:restriction system protein